jgi:hypothetical protein
MLATIFTMLTATRRAQSAVRDRRARYNRRISFRHARVWGRMSHGAKGLLRLGSGYLPHLEAKWLKAAIAEP